MTLKLPRFYPILDPSLRPDLNVEALARPLVDAGVRWIQLRMKDAPAGALYESASQLVKFLPDDTKLIVNDRADVAKLAGAAGVHLGQDDLPAADARSILGPEAIIGTSTHSRGQIEAAVDMPVDYVAIGPVFATTTKANPDAIVGPDNLAALQGASQHPLVAIGGITPENAMQAIDNGADSVAVISAWMTADDIPARLEAFRRALGRLD